MIVVDAAELERAKQGWLESKGAVLIAGPTAGGKSALALALAEALDGVIINADSMQVYRELRVLTARPSAGDEARAPHRLYGVLPAAERCSAGRWRELALAAVAEARGAGKVPVLVGGTGLYLRAFSEGLAPLPEIPDETRAAAARLYERLGGKRFRAALAKRDPETAARIAGGDRQRLLRAWEVLEATGASLADWQALPPTPPFDGPLAKLLVSPPRDELYARCDARFAAMVEGGAVAEVEALLALDLAPEMPLMKALGVRELGRFLAGETGLEDAVAAGQQATRRYAKRQLTWFRHQMADARVITAQDSESLFAETFPFICRFVLTGKI